MGRRCDTSGTVEEKVNASINLLGFPIQRLHIKSCRIYLFGADSIAAITLIFRPKHFRHVGTRGTGHYQAV
jgi:hypothetical protein